MSLRTATKIAAIDIGSNSIVLLIALCSTDGTIEFLGEHYALTKLGADVKSKHLLSNDAVEHTIATIKELKELAVAEGVSEIIVTTSSAVRMAENRNRFLVKCYSEINIFPQVLSGKEEAEYTYLGAITDVDTQNPIVTVDVGGGSTEISWGMMDDMEAGCSLDVGCVNLREEFDLGEGYYLYKRLAAIRTLRKEFSTMASKLNSWLDGRKVTVIVTGGSATTYAAIHLHKVADTKNKEREEVEKEGEVEEVEKGEEPYDGGRIGLVKVKRKEIASISRKIARMNIQERKRVPGMIMDRVYDLPAGLLIITELLRYFQFKRFFISSNGLRTGILKHYAEKYME